MFSRGDFHMPTLKKVLCDGGCTGEAFAAQIKALTGAEVEIAKRSGSRKFALISKRWIVERAFQRFLSFNANNYVSIGRERLLMKKFCFFLFAQ
jgi:transposase